MLAQEAMAFLQGIPPFQLLDSASLARLAESVALDFYPKGFPILTQGGAPSDSLQVVRTGSAKAHELLDGWAAVRQKIVKVLPSEYKRILAEKATMPETAGRPATHISDEFAAARPYVPTGAWHTRRAANG